MTAFPTTVKPIYGMTKTSQPNIKTIRYADGFEQRQLIGIAAHQNPKVYNLTFANITEAQSDEITYFLNERALDQASFTFIPEGETFTKTGTYSQSGTTITVSITAHQLFANDSISVDFTSGTASDGTFNVVSLTNADTFVLTAANADADGQSGTVSVTKTGTANFVCQRWQKTITYNGRATINATFREVFEV